MSRGLLRLVGVRTGCWVVCDCSWNNNCVIINMHGKTTIKIAKSFLTQMAFFLKKRRTGTNIYTHTYI
jgi:hypothetical protein